MPNVKCCALIREVADRPLFVSVPRMDTIERAYPHAQVFEFTEDRFSFGLRGYAPVPALDASVVAQLAQQHIAPIDPEFYSEP